MKEYSYKFYHQAFKVKRTDDENIVRFNFSHNKQINKSLLFFTVYEKVNGKGLNIHVFKNCRKSKRFIKKNNIRQKQIVHIEVLKGAYKTVRGQS